MALPGSPLPPKDAFQRLIEGLQTFIRENLALAKSEAKDELSSVGRELAIAASGLPFLLTGYLLLMVAAGCALALVLPSWAAFGIVALVNLIGGGALTFVLGKRLVHKRIALPETGQELQRNKQWVAQLKNATDVRPQPQPSQAPANLATTGVKNG
jgi:Flp pilus assembly protein TadB